jgi:ABC-type amino acid transport substrate-binding protein
MKQIALLNSLVLLVAGVLTLAGCSSAPTSAGPQHAAVPAPAPGDTTVLRVGMSPVFPPMVFKQAGELAGVEVDLARALGAKLGRRVVFVELPWEDQIEALTAGKTDIIMSSHECLV